MTIAIHELERIIKQSFPDADIKVHDLAGDNDHYHLKITSKRFLGKTKIEQHKWYIKLWKFSLYTPCNWKLILKIR